ncbi:hypothetical protein [Nocardia sp. SSK8]
MLDEYLADDEDRVGPISEEEQRAARELFDTALAESGEWPSTS